MKRLVLATLFALLMPQTGFGAEPGKEPPKSDIVIRTLNPNQNTVYGTMSVSNLGPGRVDLKANEVKTGQSLSPTIYATPVNLAILVDASQLCQSLKVDRYLDALITEVKNQLHKDSVLSVTSFTSANTDNLVSKKTLALADLEPLKCEPKAVSTSYEKPLLRFLDGYKDAGLPTTVWVFTSGNIQLSDSTMRLLEKNKLSLHLILYNSIMEADLRPMVASMNQRLGDERITLSSLAPAPNILPERWYEISFTTPKTKRFNGASVQLTASQNGKELAKQLATVSMPEGGAGTFWDRAGQYLVWGAILLVFAFALYRVVRYYRPKYCPTCKKQKRYGEALCGFCASPSEAYLVGSFNAYNRRKQGKQEVLALRSAKTEIGPNRKNAVRLVSPLGRRKQTYARIERDNSPQGHVAYRFIPTGAVPVMLNQVAIDSPRYLAPGDELVVDGATMTFVYGSSKNA